MLGYKSASLAQATHSLRSPPRRLIHTTSTLLLKHKPPKPRPLPQLDLQEILETTSTTIHNPLIELDRVDREQQAARKKREQEEFERYVPKNMGAYPLDIELEYTRRNMEFLRKHDGIHTTSTRKYFGVVEAPDIVNRKRAFGVVNVFKPFREQDYGRHFEERQFRGEFQFRKPALSYTYYLYHFDLYVRLLISLPTGSRQKYFNDFYLIIKALRQRPHIHRKILDLAQFRSLVMQYFLIVGQPNLALCTAVDLMPKALPESVPRWTVLRLLGIEALFAGDAEKLSDIHAVEMGEKPNQPLSDREYRYNLVAQSIFAYYKQLTGIQITDLELVRLIRVAENRGLLGDLMDLVPTIVRRFVQGPAELNGSDRVALMHEAKATEWQASAVQIAMRYALAFGRMGHTQQMTKFLYTLADMPPRAVGGSGGGNSQRLGRALIALLESGEDADGVVMTALEHLGKTDIEPSRTPLTRPQFKAMLVEEIAGRLCAGQLASGHATTALLGAITGRLSAFATMAMVNRLYQTSPVLGVSWVATHFYALDAAAQQESLAFVVRAFQRRPALLRQVVAHNAGRSAVATAKFIHVISRCLWERESDRFQILTKAFHEIAATGSAPAVGTLLVSAAMGPESPAVTSFGPQAPVSRSALVARLVQAVDPRSVDVSLLIPYLFKAAGCLQAKATERLLWRELLRRGIEPDWRVLQTAMTMRFSLRYNLPVAADIAARVLHDPPVSAPTTQSSAADSDSDEVPQLAGPVSQWAMYMSLMDGLNRAAMPAAVEDLAIYLLDSGTLTGRSFGALASVWLDATGFNPRSSTDDIRRVWNILGSYPQFSLNQNHYHSAIEACVRKGDVNAAWHIIQVEMRANGISPSLDTFYTLISPLAKNSKLWPIGKSTVHKFNSYYPEIVRNALADSSNTIKVKALLHFSLH